MLTSLYSVCTYIFEVGLYYCSLISGNYVVYLGRAPMIFVMYIFNPTVLLIIKCILTKNVIYIYVKMCIGLYNNLVMLHSVVIFSTFLCRKPHTHTHPKLVTHTISYMTNTNHKQIILYFKRMRKIK